MGIPYKFRVVKSRIFHLQYTRSGCDKYVLFVIYDGRVEIHLCVVRCNRFKNLYVHGTGNNECDGRRKRSRKCIYRNGSKRLNQSKLVDPRTIR